MKQLKNMQVIGIDHGYGNLKTASGIFPASVLTFDHEPVHAQDLLVSASIGRKPNGRLPKQDAA